MILEHLSWKDLCIQQLTSRKFYGYIRFIIKSHANKIRKEILNSETSYQAELLRRYDMNDVLSLFALLNDKTAQDEMSTGLFDLYFRISKQRSNTPMRRLVLKYLAHAIDTDGKTILHHAAECGNSDIIDELIRVYNVPVDIADRQGRTPLSEAVVEYMDSDITELLIVDFHADVNMKINRKWKSNGESLLHVAIDNQDYHTAEILLENGADPNAVTEYGITPLHYAVQKDGSYDTIKKLILYGANVNSKNKYGTTPLHIAVKYGTVRRAKLLVGNGADVNAFDSQRHTPLHLAANDRLSMIRYLISQKADVNAQCIAGCTPLHHAVKHQELGIVGLLVAEGANINIVDLGLQTPLSLAMQMDLPGMWHLLAQQGADFAHRDNVNSGTPLQYAQQCIKQLGRQAQAKVLQLILEAAMFISRM